ncbi:MAG: S8 family serine peptidase [Pyrinomonadaceae bacterium]
MNNRRVASAQSLVLLLGLFSVNTFTQPATADISHGAAQSGPSVTKLRKIDRERVIAAKLQGKSEVMLLLVAMPGANPAVAQELVKLGAVIRFREDAVDYLRVKVSTNRVDDVARLNAVQVMALDGVQMYDTSQDIPVSAAPKSAPPPDATTPRENSYLPIRDIGAPQFIRDHPTFDGRGVTIANVDGNSPDMLAPELQTAFSIDGTPIPKFSDVINALDLLDDESSFRIDMSNQVEARNASFEWKQTAYRSPADGTYRIGFFDISAFGAGLLRTYLPQLKQNDNSLVVLWNEESNRVWLDTNQDHSFADETAVTDFNSSYRPGILGKDNPQTPLRETVAFTILTYPQHKLIYLAPIVNGHATSTASIAAGSKFFGGEMSGVAPGSQIVSVLRKSITHSFVETMILAVKNPKVDLVSLQWAALMPPQDGNSVVGVIFRRLIDKYKKPIFASADNYGPGISTNGEPAAADKVISVGGYINRLTWQSNYGAITAAEDAVVNLSARGPRADGGFKPDLIAPAATIGADFGNYESRIPAPFKLPPGYSSGMGTSNACPMASGAAALLISAAKQSGVPYDADRIAWALKSSARYLSGIGANEQGNGLINVAAAWEALKRAPAPVTISSSTEINVAVGPYLKNPNHGPGIYEREGWQAGQSGQRTITFTRTSGNAAPTNYMVRWSGNDGVFHSPDTIQLPLNTPVALPIRIAAKTPGAHSSILNLDEPGGARSVYQVMNTVVAAEQFTPAKDYTVTREGSAEYPGYTSYFFNVPTNTSAFKVEAKIQAGTIKMRFMRPTGKEFDHGRDRPVRWQPEYQTGGTLDRIITDPEPGVWQVIVENQNLLIPGHSAALRAKFIITAAVFAAESNSLPRQLMTAVREEPNKQHIRFTNQFASFNGSYTESPLGSAFSTRASIAEGDEPLVYEINVPAGAASLNAFIRGPSSTGADVDLYLYFCAKECELKAFSARRGVDEKVIVAQPTSGKWKVVIDPVSIPSSTLTIDYTDVFTHSAFGSLLPLTTDVAVARGTTAETETTIRIDAQPLGNRRLIGLVELMSRDVATVRYEYNPATKTIEPIKERVVLAETIIELPGGVKNRRR